MEPKITTLAEIMACAPDKYGWRTLPDGRRISIGRDVSIGDGSSIGNGSSIGDGSRIGNGSSIGNGSPLQCRRSDEYVFTASWRNSDGALMVSAGCRHFTFAEAREHWTRTRGGTRLGDETLAILDLLEKFPPAKPGRRRTDQCDGRRN